MVAGTLVLFFCFFCPSFEEIRGYTYQHFFLYIFPFLYQCPFTATTVNQDELGVQGKLVASIASGGDDTLGGDLQVWAGPLKDNSGIYIYNIYIKKRIGRNATKAVHVSVPF